MENVLVIGYYDRKNIGDESYKLAFPIILKQINKITFICSDDLISVPSDTTTIICGGGDIINEYFMTKIHNILKTYTGRLYAVSVGIPFIASANYLHMFDHIFVRSMNDYNIAVAEVGERNVSFCQDISACIPFSASLKTQNEMINVGICLAQPCFYNNRNKCRLIDSLTNTLTRLYNERPNIVYHFLSFNYDDTNSECDKIINSTISKKLLIDNIPCFSHDDLISPKDMLELINNSIHVNLCMRYHSVMFSIITKTRFVPLFVSSKIRNVVKDLNYEEMYINEMSVNDKYKPTNIDSNRLYYSLNIACDNITTFEPVITNNNFNEIFDKIVTEHKLSDILVRDVLTSFEDVIVALRRSLMNYLQIDATTFGELLYRQGPFPIQESDSLDVARFICFVISGKTHHPCVWGLANKITDDDFILFESIKFIWETCKVSHELLDKTHIYYPKLNGFNRRALINLDSVFQNDFSQFHRSGWSYAIGGLMTLDAPHRLRTTDVMLDTYVDRSFHWGYTILKYLNVVPYTNPWYGFIHHTFNTDHSEFNCNNLLTNSDFLESLKCCRGLLCLSKYLADQFKVALTTLQIDVPVFTLFHPMEFVDNVFTLEKFINNQNRKIVQIGAWLRNPYGIYELPLPSNGGSLNLSKTALKGKEMDQYFQPPGFLESIENLLLKHDWFAKHPTNDVFSNICRPLNASVNKFCKGLYDQIVTQTNSVQILEKLSNEDYDDLLASNIVFLNLVDCSAVNTILECIVRNTPIIVNRLTPIEEILGAEYPGFYDTFEQAAYICQDFLIIKQIYNYLNQLDKERYKLVNFVSQLQDIITKGENTETYELFIKPKEPENVFVKQYSNIWNEILKLHLSLTSIKRINM